MKSILMSIRPQWVAKILNKEKTIEIRKKFPKDFFGWVYVYCTKGGKLIWLKENSRCEEYINGKVVARFWCNKVKEITTRQDRFKEFTFYETSLDMEDLLKQSCLDYSELDNYLYGENGYAIHITKLEIFDKPKELWEFDRCILTEDLSHDNIVHIHQRFKITKAPQSWQFIEV